MTQQLFDDWLEPVPPTAAGVPLFRERPGVRGPGLQRLGQLLADHFVGEAVVLKLGGYDKAVAVLRQSVPTRKRTRSGDLGELIATEYVDAKTPFRVPVRKLRWKSDREMPMHGNDVLGIAVEGRSIRVLKGESKSRARFSRSVVEEAAEGLDGHDGRPNPSTLAFIAKRLYEQNLDGEAKVFEELLVEGALRASDVVHFVFALAGSDPSKHLGAIPRPKNSAVKRSVAAVVIPDYANFIDAVYTHGSEP